MIETEHKILIELMTKLIFQKRLSDWQFHSFDFCTKMLGHAKSSGLISEQIYDVSSMLTLVRAQLETYATFYFLFINGDEVERTLRFNLWKVDGLKERQKFAIVTDDPKIISDIDNQIKHEKNDIIRLERLISENTLFKSFPKKIADNIIEKSKWRFNLTKIKNNEKEWVYSIKEMVWNTTFNKIILKDMYSYYSIHTHAGYVSILQNQQLTDKDFKLLKNVTLTFSNFIITQMISDYLKLVGLTINENFVEYKIYDKYLQMLNIPSR